MHKFAKDLLLGRIRRGDFGDELSSKVAATDAVTQFVDRLRGATFSEAAPVADKIAAILVANHDRLEKLDTTLGLTKVAGATADTILAIQRQLAQRQWIDPPMYYAGRQLQRGPMFNPMLHHIGSLAQLWDNKLTNIPGKPGPLSTMLVLGSLGAFGGYGVSKLSDKLQGTNNKRRRRTLTALGGAIGLVPGLLHSAAAVGAGKHPLFGQPFNTPRPEMFGKQSGDDAPWQKSASVFTQEQLRDLVEDPYVANRLPPLIPAATLGLVEGAANIPGRRRDLPVITPGDVARMAVGMGTGYASGLLVGKTLGGLLGVSDSTQQILRRSGAAAGLLRSIVPLAYGM